MNTTPVHISVLLDRSGSMASIADDVVGGFNAYLEEQRRGDGQARISLVQFDGQDPFEIVIDGENVALVSNLNPSRYRPRGNTPLLDAVGMIIARIDSEILARADMGMPIEDQVVVIVTDGYENASREFGPRIVADLIAARRARAWTFLFLAADEQTIEDGVRLGMARMSASRWEPSKQGSRDMFNKLGKETSKYRSMSSRDRTIKSKRFFDEEE